MLQLMHPEESYSRFARHGRLHQLYKELGDDDNARAHLEACQRLSPQDPELAQLWHGLYSLPTNGR